MSWLGKVADRIIDMRFWMMYATGYISLLTGIYNLVVLTSIRFPQFRSFDTMITLGLIVTATYLLFGFVLERKGWVDRDIKRQTLKNLQFTKMGMMTSCQVRKMAVRNKIIDRCDPITQGFCRELTPENYHKCDVR